MSNLSNQKPTFDLKKYLHDVYELEKKKYLLEERQAQLNKQKIQKNKSKYNSYVSPDFQLSSYYQSWLKENRPINTQPVQLNVTPKAKVTGKATAILALIGLIIGFFSSCSASVSHRSGIVWPLLVFPVAGIALGLVFGSLADRNSEEEYEAQLKKQDDQRIQQEKTNQKNQTFNNERFYYWQAKFNEEEKPKIEEDNKKKDIFDTKNSRKSTISIKK